MFEAIHREHVHGLANLGSGKGQCVLCMQQCTDVRNHQCGVLMQVSVLLGQIYDAAHLPIMPVRMRPASNAHQTTSPLPVAQEIDDSEAQAIEAQAVDRTHVLQPAAPVPATSIFDSAPPKLFKCQTCHDTFLSGVGLHTQHAKYPMHTDRATAEAANTGVQQTITVKPPKVTIKHMLACQPEGPCPESAKMYRCPICIHVPHDWP